MTVGDLMEVISSGRKVRGIPRMRAVTERASDAGLPMEVSRQKFLVNRKSIPWKNIKRPRGFSSGLLLTPTDSSAKYPSEAGKPYISGFYFIEHNFSLLSLYFQISHINNVDIAIPAHIIPVIKGTMAFLLSWLFRTYL